jgi:endonuclease-3 related protein
MYRTLYAAYGPQRWWPAQTMFEVIAGAVLTQNTAWTNVEKALSSLAQARALRPDVILEMPQGRLTALLRPSGCYNVKARRLRSVCAWLEEEGGLDRLSHLPTHDLRESLLGVHGVGEETADAILLYAFERPVFVVDAYARRLLSRMDIVRGTEPYAEIQKAVASEMGSAARDYNELHALIVEHGKRACGRKPRCAPCILRQQCPYPLRAEASEHR